MDEFKPEDELKPDPSDRRTGRSRKSSEFDNEPQLNIDDVDLDADDRRPTRARRARDEEAEYEAEEELADDADVERRPRKRKKAPAKGPVSRQHMMMGIGILVLLLLIIGIGSALKAPSSDSTTAQNQPAEKSINLNGGDNAAANQANGTQPAPGATSAENPSNGQDISLPPVSSTPTQGQVTTAPEGQQRVEVQGDLNNALTAQQGQIDAAVTNSTLPTEPATVAAVGGHNASRQQAASGETQPTRTERKQAVIEPAPRKTQPTQTAPARQPAVPKATETKPTATVKQTAPAANTSTPVKAPTATTTAPAATTTTPKATATAPTATAPAPAASAGASTGNVGSLKSAPSSHYTLQLSSSSNYNNLNAWAKKESLKNYVVYQTTRNGQPWYVLVSGVYASKEDAKRAVSALPADVQAKNPWAKPIHQVQADLKQ